MKAFSVERLAFSSNSLRNSIFKFLLAFLLVISYFLQVATPSFAQTTASNSATPPSTLNPLPSYISPQSPHSASLAIYNFQHAISCIMVGQSPIAPCLEYKPYKDATGMVKSIPVLGKANTDSGLFGISVSMIAEIIGTPPIRSSEFIADLG